MDAKHTPGPWVNRTGTLIFSGDGNDAYIIGMASGRTSEEAVANGILMWAAPDLLKALQAARSFVLGYNHGQENAVTAMIDRAIAKSEGRS